LVGKPALSYNSAGFLLINKTRRGGKMLRYEALSYG